MRQQSHKKFVEVSHWLKKTCLYFVGVFDFSGGFKSRRFAVEAGSIEAIHA